MFLPHVTGQTGVNSGVACSYMTEKKTMWFLQIFIHVRAIDVERTDQAKIKTMLPVAYGALHLSQVRDCLQRF